MDKQNNEKISSLNKIPQIKLSKEALCKAIDIKRKNIDFKEKDLRLYIEGKGCEGFYYGIIFDQRKTSDIVCFQEKNINLIVDKDTYFFVQGSLIDWLETDQESGFLVVNPKQDRFKGKFYESSRFQKALKKYKNDTKENL